MKQKMTIEEMIDLAVSRFMPTSNGEWPRPFNEIKSSHKRSTISRAIKRAFLGQHVRVISSDPADKPERDRVTEKKLVERFGLSGAIVVVPPNSNTESKRRTQEEKDKLNDSVHKLLGRATGAFMLESSLIRDGDRIACASGRSAYHAVQYLTQSPKSQLRGIQLISMAGNFQPKHYVVMKNLVLDADFITQNLACWFEEPVTVNYVGRHGVPYTEAELLRSFNDALSEKTWSKPVDIGIFGVGVMRKGYRLREIADEDGQDYDPIRRPLRTLVKHATEYQNYLYCPVADIASHLFFVEPQGFAKIPQSIQSIIQECIEKINERTFTLRGNQLRSIRRGILIAGTLEKYAAIRQMLSRPFVRYISIDLEVAQRLLK